MSFRIFAQAAVLLAFVTGQSARSQSYFSPEEMLTSALNQNNVRRCLQWTVNGNLGAVVTVSASAGSSLQQLHGVRVCVCRPDRSIVAYRCLLAGETKTLTFNLATGRYLVFFDLGVANASDPIGQISFSAYGQLTDLNSGNAVHVNPPGDYPPDPDYVPPSTISTDPLTLEDRDLIPLLNGPPQSCLVFLHD